MGILVKANRNLLSNKGLFQDGKLVFELLKNNDTGRLYSLSYLALTNAVMSFKIEGGNFFNSAGTSNLGTEVFITSTANTTANKVFFKIDIDGQIAMGGQLSRLLSMGLTDNTSFFNIEGAITDITKTSHMLFNVIQMPYLDALVASVNNRVVFNNITIPYGNSLTFKNSNLKVFRWDMSSAPFLANYAFLPKLYGRFSTGEGLLNLIIVNVPYLDMSLDGGNIRGSLQYDIRNNTNLTVNCNYVDLSQAATTNILMEGNKKTTISGSLNSLPESLSFLQIDADYTGTYSSRNWGMTMNTFSFRGSGLTTAMIDQLLIDLARVATWTGSRVVRLKGARSATSDTALSSLQSKNVTVSFL